MPATRIRIRARAVRAALALVMPCALLACDVLDETRVRSRMRVQDPAAVAPVDAGRPRTADTAFAGNTGSPGPVGPDQGSRPPTDPAGAGGAAAGASGSAAVPECSPPAVDDYCTRIPALAAEPVIDGQLDCGARLLQLPAVGWNGANPLPAQHRALLAAAKRPDGLYLYLEVHGGEPPRPHPAGSGIHCGDAVEIYVDADGAIDALGAYSAPGTMQFIIAAPTPPAAGTIEALRFVAGENQGAWSSQQVRTRSLDDGYAVEALITARDLELTAWSPAGRIGFDIADDVSATASSPELACGLQLGQYFLRMGPDGEDDAGVCHGEPWCDSRAFCTPAL